MRDDVDIITRSGRTAGTTHNTFQLLCSKLTSEIQIRFAKTVWGFGQNDKHSLGLFLTQTVEFPSDIISMRRKQVAKIVGGADVTILLSS
jgi:hypothetical protein